jgi:hypothetical protein
VSDIIQFNGYHENAERATFCGALSFCQLDILSILNKIF